ncbi:ATP-binding cassette domain-containing protein [Anaerococcus lactolyticus]|uniref:Nickel import system ATP-binding protein NikD n=1 Tax=Anaerococcus lactolyticus S7-1-13 TaxID=1284686 RepID=A0A095YAS4_9FIRM|nr:ABC transporter ATP-binding protein [Anaerococcus lactolyticus]KGF03692.1 ATPase [Anaerococcus lactolyticus S7-1-13]
MNILEIKNLNISFFQYQKGLERRRLDVVRNLDLNLKKGEIMAVFGASGSGKSLLAHAILGLLPYNGFYEGEVCYKGKILDENLLEKVRGKEIFFIPQTINSLNPLLKTAKQARLTLKRSDYKRQEEVYRNFGLGKEVDKMYPFELSGGMARRVLVADAFLSGAELIIADEPTPGMDKKATDEIIAYFKDLKAAGKTSLIISHDINMALALADRIAIFYDGRIIEVSPVEAFSNGGEDLRNPYSRMLIKALPENGLTLLSKEEVEGLC